MNINSLVRSTLSCFGVTLAALVFFPAIASAQVVLTEDNLTDEHVTKAIGAIVEELYRRKDPKRFWDPVKPPTGESTRQGGGYTALTVLALLYAGESYQNPRLRDAVDYLEEFTMQGTYAVSIRAAVWARLPEKYRHKLGADVQWLLDGFNERSGGWGYVQNERIKTYDNSLRQFGALALWEAAKRGGKINPKIWMHIENGLFSTQNPDGGWNYTPRSLITSGSMTTAGLATLFITQDYLHAEESLEITDHVGEHQKAIARGLKWLDENFSPTLNPGILHSYYYYMYGIERVGLASGIKYFGEIDWFRAGATELINRLCHWDPKTRSMTVHNVVGGKGRLRVKVRYLDFGLMFLSRGRVPVAMNKLRDPTMAWNNRPRDVANLAARISLNSETPVNWQIVDIHVEPEQWLDAPLIYLASDNALSWHDEDSRSVRSYVRKMRSYEKKRATGEIEADTPPPVVLDAPVVSRMKRYLDLGGLLFAVNETKSKSFTNSIEKLGQIMYPHYDWRKLPRDHWAYTIHEPVTRRRPILKGLSNGVRELIILSPGGDMARTFQGRDATKDSQFQTASNIYFYASEMDRPRPRLEVLNRPDPSTQQTQTTATLVRAIFEGNWNPEPLAVELFASKFAVKRGVGVNVVRHALAGIDKLSPAPDLVMVCGVERHEFSPAQTTAITEYIQAGGVILFETPGGRGEFTLSAEEMMTEAFNLPIQSALRTRIITGESLEDAPDLTRLDYRPYSLLEAFGMRETTPRLRCMMVNGEPRILFSREDISQALLDQGVWGVSGYQPESAFQLLGNIVQYARSLD